MIRIFLLFKEYKISAKKGQGEKLEWIIELTDLGAD
jgi:hypothetical protein